MSASNTNNPGYSAGEGIKGIFNTVHGVGETIRGNINGLADGAGDAITQRNSTTNTASATSAQANVGVAEKGNAEIARGIDKL